MNFEIRESGTIKERQNDITIRVGDRNFPDEINRVMVGSRKSENKEVKVENKTFRMEIKKIEEKILPEINDAFAQKMNFANTEELKKKLLENCRKREEKRIEEELKESLSNVILERIKFNVPQTLIQNEYQKILQKSNLPDSDSNKERFSDIAEKRVRLNLILEKIAEKENIKVQKEEIMNLISALGIKLNDENRDEVLSYVGNILVRDRTLDFLFKNARVSEKSRIISPKEALNDTRAVRH
jgi:trigger factor